MGYFEKTSIINPYGNQDDVLHIYVDSTNEVYRLDGCITQAGTYTFSVWIRADTESQVSLDVLGKIEIITVKNEWGKYIVHVVIEDLIENHIDLIPSKNVDTYFYEAKLQEGNYDTRWSPAEEDIQETFLTYQSKIEANENAIKFCVTRQEYIEYKSVIDGEVAETKSKLSTVESDISTMQGEISLKVEQTDIENYVDTVLESYVTTSQMASAIELSSESILSSVSQIYSLKSDLEAESERISVIETWKTEASQKITKDGIITTVGNYYAYESDLQSAESRISTVETQASQTATQFSWIVKSGTSSTDFLLTDRAIELFTDTIDLSASNLINIISAGTAKIKAHNIDLEGIVTANENFKILEDGSMEAANGKFSGQITATSGSFKGTVDAEILKVQNNISIYDGAEEQVVVSYYNASSSVAGESGRSTGIEFGNSAVEATYSSRSNLFAGTAYFSKEAQFNAGATFYDSIVFPNAKGIRAMDSAGGEHAVLYIDASDIVTAGNTSQVTKIQGSSIQAVGTVYLGNNIVVNNNNAYYCKSNSGTNRQIAMIDENDTFFVGSPSHITAIRGTSVRLTSATGTVVTSDRRAKKEIYNLNQRHLDFLMDLNPVHFKMIESNDQKVRYGFIAQDVESALRRHDFTRDDFAGLDVAVENGQEVYGLIYEQFTSLITYAIQCTRKEVLKLKEELYELRQKSKNQQQHIESLQYQIAQAFDRICQLNKKGE